MANKRSLLAKFGDRNGLLIPTGGFFVLTLILSIIFIILGKTYILFFIVPISIMLIGLILLGKKSLYERAIEDLENIIYDSVRKYGLNRFNLGEVIENSNISYPQQKYAAQNTYKRFLREALKDLTINEKERTVLNVLGRKLLISDNQLGELERQVKSGIYNHEIKFRTSDNVLSADEELELRKIRVALGLAEIELANLTRETALDKYSAMFENFARTGIINTAEFQSLNNMSKSTGLSVNEAAKCLSNNAENLYRRTVSMICQDGILTEEEIKVLDTLESLLCLPSEVKIRCGGQVQELKVLQTIRKGKLPIVNDHKYIFRSTELCHFSNICKYLYETTTRSVRLAGNLVVTNRRVIFTSPEKSLEFSVKKIVNIITKPDSVHLELSASRGQGHYYVDNARILGPILEAIVRRFNFSLAENMDSSKTRRIPDEVKVAVWQRDGGRCIKCQANDYLEYDHVIPFSKGGANTEKNLQLLCRKCNSQKGNELV